MSVPTHRPASIKFNPDEMVKTMIPLTQEDKELSGNLPLINTLRQAGITSPRADDGGHGAPSFYDDDQRKWAKKFAKAIGDRQEFKKKYLSTRKTTVLNSNDNVTSKGMDWDAKLKNTAYTSGQLIPHTSEFKQVLKRRKSRQSTQMPTQIDFEYTGNSCAIMEKHLRANHDMHQLNFELNLRNYKNKGSFNADEPWHYPSPKAFRPAVVLEDRVKYVEGSNFDMQKNKFLDKFVEPNANAILHTLEKSTSVYRNAEWQASLRNDRQERVQARTKTNTSR